MNLSLPHFHCCPEPLTSGNIEASATTCQCCGKAHGYVYTGSSYSRHELSPGSLYPWCTADGSATARYEASFSDSYPLLDAGAAVGTATKVYERTPGYTSWQQQERWLICCKDACAFHGDAGREGIRQLGAEGLAQRFADFVWPANTWQHLVDAYAPDDDPAIYRFDCLHCGRAYYDLGFT